MAAVPATAYETSTNGVVMRPTGDLDGDGRPDVVSLSRALAAAGVGSVTTSSGSVVLGLRGSDGARLWRTAVEHPATDLLDVGTPDGRTGVVVVGGDTVTGPTAFGGPADSAVVSQQRTLQLTSLGPDGGVVWERGFDSGDRAQLFPVGDADASVQVFRSYATVRGTLQAAGDATDDVLVTITDRTETPAGITSTTSVLVIDGATGETAAETVLELSDARPSALPADDLDGDGIDDVLVVSPGHGAGAGVQALSGASLQPLWSTPTTQLPPLWGQIDAGDVDGDGVDDLVVSGHQSAVIVTRGGIGPLERFLVFSGATGAELLREEATHLYVLGSLDGSPGVELGLQTAIDDGSAAIVRYEAMSAGGGGFYSEEHRLETGTSSVELRASLGDVDGDGIADAAHGIDASDDQDAVISGRTGQVLRPGPVHSPIGALQDGAPAKQARVVAGEDADSVHVELINGFSAAVEWVSPPLWGGANAVFRTADVTGDGVRDVVVDFWSNPRSAAVLDGRTGAALWQAPDSGS
jgi:hypothetical protein